uniref:Uncharacterized protein n=1 Tax=Alexandrium catenella TaxID=2925 RepID=A0A7S1RLM7_ALECA|mmetsp:Transcript_6384/g.17157  ORF Transcript_6384/g.17157 Transcript_6384/m.17157 type:complete len:571 (+) Transcript_6384:91-1803(+)
MASTAGSDAAGGPAKAKLTSVAFWGICDIKYDPRLPNPRDRVRLLELGDGRSSRFSHHGRAIKEKFEAEFCMDENPIKRAVMTENKKLTHDMFMTEGFSYLRPPTVACPRRYHTGLADDILTDLGIRDDDGEVVLKLCNRSRGAGIVVAKAYELDSVLRQLLSPPMGAAMEGFLAKRVSKALEAQWLEVTEEQRLHWWSNECPIFVAERCCHSIPVAMEGSDKKFDGTMRVAFALYRKVVNKYHEAMHVKPFDIAWLGGYWKLPKVSCEDGGDDLLGLHERIVSSFNSVEKRTAEVSPEHLQEVFDALTPALPAVFHSGSISVHRIMNFYQEDPLFRAFALSRVAATMRAGEMPKALGLFDLARRLIKVPTTPDANNLPESSVLSYIERNAGVCPCLEGKWDKAAQKWRLALRLHPLNSTAHYCVGCAHQELDELDFAIECQLKSIALDPDFKSPYCALGNCHMLKGSFDAAVEAGVACLRRHPDAPVAHFVIAQSIYHRFCRRQVQKHEDSTELADRAQKAFELAKRRSPEQWTESDEAMLEYFLHNGPANRYHPEEAVHVWKVYGWRP